MELFKVKTLDEAKAIVMDAQHKIVPEFETVDLLQSHGRILAENLYSPENVPAFNRSTVDGYAVQAKDLTGASEGIPSLLEMKDEVLMGLAIEEGISSGEAIYVPTGGMLPPGADGVVMIEHCEMIEENSLLIKRPIAHGENVINQGDDIKEKELILERGKRISSYHMGMLASVGISRVRVQKPVRIAILSTGDELIDVHETPKLGQIRDINGPVLMGMALACGASVVYMALVKDDFKALEKALIKSLELADLVILSGGSSVGTRDFTQKVMDSFEDGKIMVHGISVKPGKPTIVGKIGSKMVFGLPGHPAASAILFEVLVTPYIFQCQHRHEPIKHVSALLTNNLHASPGKDMFVPVKIRMEDGLYYARPLLGKSGLISVIAKADGYLKISSEIEGLYKNTQVQVNLFTGGGLFE